ncbi:MAG: aldehyde dehydrogenase family protein, partial [Rubrivivax sp.]
MIRSINPASGEQLAGFEAHDAAAVEQRLAAAVVAQRAWRQRSVLDRMPLLTALAQALRANIEPWSRLITLEMGKPLAEARAEIEKCAMTCDFYAANAPAMLNDEPVASAASDSRVVYDPLGVLLAVMPWNYPFWQAVRAIVPALAAGNAVLLKHASNVPQCALALERLFVQAGTPPGLFATLLVGAPTVAP